MSGPDVHEVIHPDKAAGRWRATANTDGSPARGRQMSLSTVARGSQPGSEWPARRRILFRPFVMLAAVFGRGVRPAP